MFIHVVWVFTLVHLSKKHLDELWYMGSPHNLRKEHQNALKHIKLHEFHPWKQAFISLSSEASLPSLDFSYIYLQNQDPQARVTNLDDGEIFDEIITRSRGEIRLTQSPKLTSSTPTSLEDIRPAHSPRISQRVYSPHVNELRGEQSPRLKRKGLEAKQTPSPGPSILGQSPRDWFSS